MSNAKVLRAVKLLREHAIGLDMELEQVKRQVRETRESLQSAEQPKEAAQNQVPAVAGTKTRDLAEGGYPNRVVLDALPDLVPAAVPVASSSNSP